MSPSGPKVGTGSSGRTRAAGSTTGSERRSRRQRAARSSSPSTVTTSGTAAAPETERTDRDDPGESTKPLRPEVVLKTRLMHRWAGPASCPSGKQTGPVCVSADPVLQTGTNGGGTEEDQDRPSPGRTEEELLHHLSLHLHRLPSLLSLLLSAAGPPPDRPPPAADRPTRTKLIIWCTGATNQTHLRPIPGSVRVLKLHQNPQESGEEPSGESGVLEDEEGQRWSLRRFQSVLERRN